MKTIIAGLVAAYCVTIPPNAMAQEKPVAPPADKKLDAEYHGPNAHCKTVKVRKHGHVEAVRKCKD